MADGFDVREWRRYGHQRLYVTAVDGTNIGWRDLVTGEDHPEFPDLLRVLQGALERHGAVVPGDRPESAAEGPQEPSAPSSGTPMPEAGSEPADRPWKDLAQHRPGQMVREVAEAEWAKRKAEKPVRAVLGRLLNVHTDERAWRIGAGGEEAVGAQIAKLNAKDPYWTAIHSIPVGDRGSDIDHLVIGPGGVFTINAKHHPGAKIWVAENVFMVNGKKYPYLRNARHEAARASRLLTTAAGFEVPVVAVLVPVNAEDIKIKKAPADVAVVNRMRLVRWLRGFRSIMTPEQINTIYEAARRSTTWRP